MRNIFKKDENEELDSMGGRDQHPRNRMIIILIALILLVVLLFGSCSIRNAQKENASEQQDAIAQLSDTTDSMIAELDAIRDRLSEMDSAVLENMELIESHNGENTLQIEKTLEEIQKNVDVLQTALERIKESNTISTKETTQELETIQANLDSLQKELSDLVEKDFSNISSQISSGNTELIEQIHTLSERLDDSRDSIEDLINRIAKTELKNQEELKKILEDMRKEYAKNLNDAKEEMEALETEHYADLKSTESEHYENMKDAETKHFKEMEDLETKHFNELSDQMDSLHGQIESTQSKISSLQETLQDENEKNMETIREEFLSVQKELDIIQDAYTISQKSIEDLIKKFAEDEQSHHENTIESLKEMNDNLLQSGADNLSSMITNLSELEESYLNSMDELTQYLGSSFSSVNESIENTEEYLANQFDTKYQLLLNGQNEMNQNISNRFTTITNSMESNNDDVIGALQAAMNEVKGELQSVFTYVSNGKRLLASALLTKGVNVPEDATFEAIKEAILSINQTIYLGTETQYLLGTISYDYHYHVNGSGAHVGSAEMLTSAGGCYTIPAYHVHQGNVYTGGDCYQTPVYHVHTGNASSGGGCYGRAYQESYEYRCGWVGGSSNASSYGGRCPNCGSGLWRDAMERDNDGDGVMGEYYTFYCKGENNGTRYVTKYAINCGKTPGQTIDSYKLTCTKTSSTIDGYKPSCGLSDGQIIGAHIIYNQAASANRMSRMAMMYNEVYEEDEMQTELIKETEEQMLEETLLEELKEYLPQSDMEPTVTDKEPINHDTMYAEQTDGTSENDEPEPQKLEEYPSEETPAEENVKEESVESNEVESDGE